MTADTAASFTAATQHECVALGIAPTTSNLRRIPRALDLIKRERITQINPTTYAVRSQYDSALIYIVRDYGDYLSCSCPDHAPHCKHIIAVRIYHREQQRQAEFEHFLRLTLKQIQRETYLRAVKP